VASALLFRPLPGLQDPARLVDIGRTQDGRGFDTTSYPNYRDVRERTKTLSEVYAYRIEPQPMSLAGAHEAERVYGTSVSGNYFTVLGTRAQYGRLFTDQDDVPGRNQVTVISNDLWRRYFGGDPSLVGRTVTITGQPYAVIGIAPPGFQGTTLLRSDLWLPLSTHPRGHGEIDMFTGRQVVWLVMGGRLKPGVTIGQANAELRTIGETLTREHPQENEGKGLAVAASSVIPGRIGMVSGFLAILMAIVSLVLLIACVNLAGMLLARAAARRREIAIRLAIGAGRIRLVRQLLTETVVLFGAGCGAGLVLSSWLTALLMAVLPQLPLPVGIDMVVDWRVVSFAVGLSFISAILCGLAPSLHASRPELVPSLKIEGLDSGGARLPLRSVFVVGQIALSLLLMIAASLFLRALTHAVNMQPGFDQTNVDTVTVDFSLAGYTEAQGRQFADDLLTRTRALPGVRAATLSVDLPLDGGRMGFGDLRLPGAPRDAAPHRRDAAPIDWNIVTPGFFTTLGVHLVRGRDFTATDTASAPHVAIVNQTLARQFFGDADALERQLEMDTPDAPKPTPLTIVGIAADAQFVSLGETASPYIYVPLAQLYHPRVSLLVKSAAGSMSPQIRALLRDMNPKLPPVDAMPLSEVTAIGLVPQRLAASVSGTLGIVGLLLAAIGIYGVTSYSVSRRSKEIGIRMALGADRSKVLSLVLRQGLLLAGIGIAIGLAAGALAAQLLQSLLYGISTLDPLAFASAVLLFMAVALGANYIPARRATRIDPMIALRTE
jgi:putative ABC transport system permease protein